MILLKWIGQVLTSNQERVSSPLDSHAAKTPRSKELLDIANEVLRSDAEDLLGLLNTGMPAVSRKKLKKKVKGKVMETIDEEFNDPEIVEEVTERIMDAVEFDPYYRKMFED